MQKLLITWARLCNKSKFYDSFSYQSSSVFPLILICNISFENGLKRQIQWYNNQNDQIKTIEMTKLWTNLPSNHLKPQMHDSVSFSHIDLGQFLIDPDKRVFFLGTRFKLTTKCLLIKTNSTHSFTIWIWTHWTNRNWENYSRIKSKSNGSSRWLI